MELLHKNNCNQKCNRCLLTRKVKHKVTGSVQPITKVYVDKLGRMRRITVGNMLDYGYSQFKYFWELLPVEHPSDLFLVEQPIDVFPD
jgi:hypothetical protein